MIPLLRCCFFNVRVPYHRNIIESQIRVGKYEAAKKRVREQFKLLEHIVGYRCALEPEHGEIKVERTAQRLAKKFGLSASAQKQFDFMFRLVVGMTLYLKALPPRSSHKSDWRERHLFGVTDPNAITKKAEICTVSSIYELTREERIFLGLEGTAEERAELAMSFHFREAHWRRPPGLGHDPEAPKIVHVRFAIVREDRRPPDGGLPGGSEKILGL